MYNESKQMTLTNNLSQKPTKGYIISILVTTNSKIKKITNVVQINMKNCTNYLLY